MNQILWSDDEIDLLKPYIIYLSERGYNVTPVCSGQDAIDLCKQQAFDIVFLDEQMPGLSGIETLQELKKHILKAMQQQKTRLLFIIKREQVKQENSYQVMYLGAKQSNV